MCTAVDGGSIHRAARSTIAASHQISTTPIASHRAKDRRRLLRVSVLGGASGFSVTFQNNSLGWLPHIQECWRKNLARATGLCWSPPRLETKRLRNPEF